MPGGLEGPVKGHHGLADLEEPSQAQGTCWGRGFSEMVWVGGGCALLWACHRNGGVAGWGLCCVGSYLFLREGHEADVGCCSCNMRIEGGGPKMGGFEQWGAGACLLTGPLDLGGHPLGGCPRMSSPLSLHKREENEAEEFRVGSGHRPV